MKAQEKDNQPLQYQSNYAKIKSQAYINNKHDTSPLQITHLQQQNVHQQQLPQDVKIQQNENDDQKSQKQIQPIETIEDQAYKNLYEKLNEQRTRLYGQHQLFNGNEHSQLFENTNQNILATLKQVQLIKEWNDLVSTMLEAEDQPDQIMQFNLIRNRRVKGRQINGSVELFLIQANNQEAENMKQQMIDCLDEIEKTELDITNLEENNENINPQNNIEGGGQQQYNFNKHAGGIRNKKFLAGELKLKINRLTEEYEQLNKLFRKAQKLQQ